MTYQRAKDLLLAHQLRHGFDSPRELWSDWLGCMLDDEARSVARDLRGGTLKRAAVDAYRECRDMDEWDYTRERWRAQAY